MMAARKRFRWVPFAAGLGLTACAGLVGLFVSQKDSIRVPHERHRAADVECIACHETIFDSTHLNTHDFPKEKKCLECHKDEKQKGNCAFCHTNAEKPATVATRVSALKMNHAEHLVRVNEDCSVCHKALPEPVHTEGLAPSMDSCRSCHVHEEQYQTGQCEVCHQSLTQYRLKPVGDFSHRGDFTKSHRLEARSPEANCGTCHEQTFCSECHAKTVATKIEVIMPERVDRNFIHRHDFLSRHAVEARADEASCQRCHGLNFCQSCHANNALRPGGDSTLDPHPPGFGQGSAHGVAARQDIVSCAACHDQGATSNCVSCHRVGGIAGNPHPPTWLVRHRTEEIGRNAMCQVCHL